MVSGLLTEIAVQRKSCSHEHERTLATDWRRVLKVLGAPSNLTGYMSFERFMGGAGLGRNARICCALRYHSGLLAHHK